MRSFLDIGQLTAVFGLALAASCLTVFAPKSAEAGPLALSQPTHSSPVIEAQIFERGRPPQYPYVIRRGPRWDSYFGFVPYENGNIENQALRRSQSPSIWLKPEANPAPNQR
ncbi:hypothetical protein A7A08_01962 [Methyloligella halotolerans]|uniref:Uncharacterized protein n=1 Tax=Methyloligella halotolerans TaxID=1177755 RepID=A0A1E2RYM6_9HYPH|nr:hypothetical protein [Methyloligella halotolerans]ODA67215.1 hypothetical protein A7A08_01962 [Methyloligella halotolerans]